VSRISLSVVEGDKNIHLKERGGKVVAKLIGQVKLLRIVFSNTPPEGHLHINIVLLTLIYLPSIDRMVSSCKS